MLAHLGVEFHLNTTVDADMLERLEAEHDAIFLGVGLGAIHRLGLAREDDMAGITNALTLIADYKRGAITGISGRVAVIGAGNTAIDAANASVRLGARKSRWSIVAAPNRCPPSTSSTNTQSSKA